MYTAHVLTDESRLEALNKFVPKYPTVIAHHITIEFGVPVDTETPTAANIRVVGFIDSGDGLQTLICTVNGSKERPDGGTYHITWSLDDEKYKPVDSNALIKDTMRYTQCLPFSLDTVPAVLD